MGSNFGDKTQISKQIQLHFVYTIPSIHLHHKTNSSALVYTVTPDKTVCNCEIAQFGRGTHNRAAVATHHARRPATQSMRRDSLSFLLSCHTTAD